MMKGRPVFAEVMISAGKIDISDVIHGIRHNKDTYQTPKSGISNV